MELFDIQCYGAYLDFRSASHHTISSYLRDVTQFSDYLHSDQDVELRSATSDAVENERE